MTYWKVKPKFAGKRRGEDNLPLVANELYTLNEWLHYCNLCPLSYTDEISLVENNTYWDQGSRFEREA